LVCDQWTPFTEAFLVLQENKKYTKKKNKISDKITESDELRRTVAASAAAGLVARIFLHPLDTVKSRMQVAKSGELVKVFPLLSAPGLYRGFTVAAAGSIPGVTLYFTSFHVFKNFFGKSTALPTAAGDFSAGFLAEAVSCAFWVPVDVVKERLQVNPSTNFSEIFRAVGVRGMYRGYFATLASYGPFSAVYFALVEALKRKLLPASLAENVLVCGSAGAFAALVTTPLDLVKLRLQVPNFRYANFRAGLREVAATEGARGLFRGATPRVLFSALNTAITMGAMESFLRL
jgi:hypothetical protein